MTLDPAKLRAETLALIDGTTPGPWSVFINDAGDKWTGWPLSVSAESITDKTITRPGGHRPYEWDAKTSQHEACQNACLIAAAPTLAADTLRLLDEIEARDAEIERLRGVLERIEFASRNWATYEAAPDAVHYAHESTARLARAALAEGDPDDR